MKKSIVGFILIFLWANFCFAETFCVSQDGSVDCGSAPTANRFSVDDFNDTSNWDDDAVDDGAIGPGDTVYLSGRLENPDSVTGDTAVLNVQQGGTDNNTLLTILADPNDPPLIYGAGSVSGWDWEKVAFSPIGAESYDVIVNSYDGWAADMPGPTYGTKIFEAAHTDMTIDCTALIGFWTTWSDNDTVRVLTLSDNSTQRAWVDIRYNGNDNGFEIKYTVADNSETTGWQLFGEQTGMVAYSFSVYYKQQSSAGAGAGAGDGEGWLTIHDENYDIAGTGSLFNEGFNRVNVGAVEVVTGSPTGVLAIKINSVLGSGNEPGAKNIWRTVGQPSMLWDTKGTLDFSDDVALMEYSQLAQLADNETGWYQDSNIVLLKLSGNDAPTADIEATASRGLSIIHTAPISFINIGDDSHSITFEKCGGLGLKQNGIILGAITTHPHPINNFVINNCKINRSIGMAVYLWGGGKEVKIYNNTIDTVIPRYGNYGGEGGGIRIVDPGSWSLYNPPEEIEIFNNELSRIHYGAIGLGGGKNIKIYGNYLHDVPLPRYDNTKYGPYCWGSSIHLEAEDSSDPLVTRFFEDVEIYENTLVETGEGIRVSGRGTDNETFKTRDIKIYNNTIVGPQGVPWSGSDAAIAFKYVENVEINNNTIISPVVNGIYVGSGHGAGYEHDIEIYENIIYEPGNYLIEAGLLDCSAESYNSDFTSYDNAFYASDWKISSEYTSAPLSSAGALNINWVGTNKPTFSESYSAAAFNTDNTALNSDLKLIRYYDGDNCLYECDRAIAANYTVYARLYFDKLGVWTNDNATREFFNIKVDNGDDVLDVYFAQDGVRIYNGTNYHLIEIEDMAERYAGKWTAWWVSVREDGSVARIRVDDEYVLNAGGSYASCTDCLQASDPSTSYYPITLHQKSNLSTLASYVSGFNTKTDIIDVSSWNAMDFVSGECAVCGTNSPCPDGYVCASGFCELDAPPVIGDGPFVAAGAWSLLPTASESAIVLAQNYNVLWTFSDDFASCSGDCTHSAEYQEVGDSGWTALTVTDNPAQGYAYVTLPVDSLDDGTYAFRFSVIDCADQTTQSGMYYFEVEN